MRSLPFLSFLVLATSLFGQRTDYFQQEVNYDIDVLLDDTLHFLHAQASYEYTNNSPQTLDKIYFHVWPNAYRDTETDFAKQMLEGLGGSTRFQYSKRSQRGYCDSLDFQVNGEALRWEDHPTYRKEVAIVYLNTPLQPGETVVIKTPFRVKIPRSFSRLGRVRQSYQMTQWYPKPAVYDRKGWNVMPYLNQGEFFSEFGSFDVSITLPENYLVAATGELQEQSEKDFLAAEEVRSNTQLQTMPPNRMAPFPKSSTKLKTISYKQDRIHDFAWFADKRFYVQSSSVNIEGKDVKTYAFFTDREASLWMKATQYLNRSVKFYSDHVGAYPYSHATAVQSALSAGGGMEYPMITVIGLSGDAESLDAVITHEMGHIWFYGILASNERQHPWMDEGMNSYYENRYMKKYYGDLRKLSDFLGPLDKVFSGDSELDYSAYLLQQRPHRCQAVETPSQDLRPINYFLSGYATPAMMMRYLEGYLGIDQFDAAMKTYFQTWKYKHPYPEDFRTSLEASTNKHLDWWFDGMLQTTDELDYKLVSVKDKTARIKNTGEISGPVNVSALKDGEVIWSTWIDGFDGSQDIEIAAEGFDRVMIDPKAYMLESNRGNNLIRMNGGLFKRKESVQVKLLDPIETPDKHTFRLLPALAWNDYNGFQLGIATYSSLIPQKKLQWAAAPMFGFKSKTLSGTAEVRLNTHPDFAQEVVYGLKARAFATDANDNFGYSINTYKATPFVQVDFKPKKPRSSVSQRLVVESQFLLQENAQFEVDTTVRFTGKDATLYTVPKLTYTYVNARTLHPYSFKSSLTFEQYDGFSGDTERYLKLAVEGKLAINYSRFKRIRLRAFAGYFLMNTRRESGAVSNALTRGSFALAHQGYNDYTQSRYFLGRSDAGRNNGFLSQQVAMEEGQFKTPFGPVALGQSNDAILAFNLSGDLPIDVPVINMIKPYADIGWASDRRPIATESPVLFNGGLMLDVYNGAVQVHFPLFSSEEVDLALRSRGNYLSRVSFSINLLKLGPFQLPQQLFAF